MPEAEVLPEIEEILPAQLPRAGIVASGLPGKLALLATLCTALGLGLRRRQDWF